MKVIKLYSQKYIRQVTLTQHTASAETAEERTGNPLSEERIAELEAQMEQIRQEAYQEGFEKGLQEGIQSKTIEGQSLLDAFMQKLEQKSRILDSEYKNFFQDLEEQVMNLTFYIIEHLLQKEIGARQYSIEKIVKMAMEEILESKPGLDVLEIHCHPEDAVALQELNTQSNLLVVPDAQIPRADCFFKTSLGKITVSLQERLQQIKESVTGSRS